MERTIRILIVVFVSLGLSPLEAASDIEVCPQCEVKTLKQAILFASKNSTILVKTGEYHESDIVIDKPLKIIAAPDQTKPIINIDGNGNGFTIKSDHVEINGFLIKNSGFSYTEEMAGIKVSKSSDCTIKNNHLKDNSFGVYISGSKSCHIDNNKISGTNKSETLSGNGIHIWNSKNMLIENNEFMENRDGIYFEFVNNSIIRKNKSIGNLRYGLHFMYSHFNEYRENLFQKNESGVAVMYSHDVQMFRNRFEQNHGPASYGILLKDISDSIVAGNTFFDNTVGIFIDGTSRTSFEGNYFKNNGWALRVLGSTDSNKFSRNDFIANTFDVTTNSTSNENVFIENYWSLYKGLDLDNDGFGDELFRPVRLSSLLIEHYQPAIILIHSLFFSILDSIENALPVLTPESYKDNRPRMTRATEL